MMHAKRLSYFFCRLKLKNIIIYTCFQKHSQFGHFIGSPKIKLDKSIICDP